MNNLFGHAMSQYLPYANFKWVKNINEIEQKLMKIKSNSSTGYVLEVDLEYQKTYIMNIVIIHQHQKKLTYKKNGYQIIVQKL